MPWVWQRPSTTLCSLGNSPIWAGLPPMEPSTIAAARLLVIQMISVPTTIPAGTATSGPRAGCEKDQGHGELEQ